MKKQLYLVAGLGQTGYATAGYLQRKKIPFVVFDTRRHVERLTDFSAAFPLVEVYLGDFPSSLYPKITQIIASPGLSLEEPFLEQAKRHGIPIIGDIELFARDVTEKSCNKAEASISASIIAITGTNGKSTVTTMVGEMAKVAGKRVAVAGNIGLPILDLLAKDTDDYELWVLELSSFQLDLTMSLAPIAATVLNITPDHLDRHHDMAGYTKAKQRVFHNAQYCLYNRQDPLTKPQEFAKDAAVASFGLDAPKKGEWGLKTNQETTYIAYGDELIFPVHALKIQGQHNWLNALAATALAHRAGIATPVICNVLETFSGLEHRCQTVRKLNDVIWINDSKGTNVGASISAIEGLGSTIKGKIILIAGGLGKGADFSPLATLKHYIKNIILIGKDAPIIKQDLANKIPMQDANSLEEAVRFAYEAAKSGDVVLLSPACASMDMFKDYIHRGQCFVELVTKL